MNKQQYRYDKIQKIIERNDVATQEQLLGMLKDYGINVSQVTISRDLTALHIKRRLNSSGIIVYCLPEAQDYDKSKAVQLNNAKNERPMIADVKFQGTTCIIKTRPCHAQAIAAAIDSMNNPLILGTIAGIDTIFMIIADKLHYETIRAILRKNFHYETEDETKS